MKRMILWWLAGVLLLLASVSCFADESKTEITVRTEGEFALGQQITWTILPETPGNYEYVCTIHLSPDSINDFDSGFVGEYYCNDGEVRFIPVVSGEYKIYFSASNVDTGQEASLIMDLTLDPSEDFPSVKTRVEQVAAQCCAECDTDYEKALWLYHYLHNRRAAEDVIRTDDCWDWNFHSAEGILVRGIGVCQSFSEAYAMLCQAAGLEADVVAGLIGGEPHAWNAVKISGSWVLADTHHEYFGLSYEAMECFGYTFYGCYHGTDVTQCTTLEYNPHYRKVGEGLILAECDNTSEERLLRFWVETASVFRTGAINGELVVPDWYQDEKMRSNTEILQWGAEKLNECSGWTRTKSVYFNGQQTDMEVYEPTYFYYRDSNSYVPGHEEYIQIANGSLPEIIEDDTPDGLHYRWVAEDRSLTVTGDGEMADYTGDDLLSATFRPWGNFRTSPGYFIGYVYPVENVCIEDGVTSVGGFAFYHLMYNELLNMPSLTSVSVGDDVIQIGSHAFEGAKKLQHVRFGSSVHVIGDSAFDGCSSLKPFSFPESLSEIGTAAFKNCSDALTTLSLPSGVQRIGSEAFSGCSSLGEVMLCAGIESIGDSAFNGCNIAQVIFFGTEDEWNAIQIGTGNESLTEAARIYVDQSSGTCGEELIWRLENGVLTISGEGPMQDYSSGWGDGASPWAGSTVIRKVVFENGVTSVGSNAFLKCAGLKVIEWSDSVVSIGDNAFESCTAVQTLHFPNRLNDLGSRSFMNCFALETVNLPDSLEQIGEAVFKNDFRLITLTLGRNLSLIGNEAFYGCGQLRSFTLPDSLQCIGSYAFYDCSSLESIDIPGSTESIGDHAFSGCTKMAEVTFHEGLISIGDYTFYGLDGNKSLTLPESLKHIGSHCFEGNYLAERINIPQGIEYIGDFAFYMFGYSALDSYIEMPDSLDSLQYLGDYAFRYTSLTGITLGSALTELRGNFASGCYRLEYVRFPDTLDLTVDDLDFSNCVHLTSLVTPEGMHISHLNLSGCSSLETLVIGGSWSYGNFAECKFSEISPPEWGSDIREQQFLNCINLKSYVVVDGTSEIGDRAFDGCVSLTDITIPASVKSIGASAIPAAATIYCYYGSYAGEWAAANGNPVVYLNEKLLPPDPISVSETGIASWDENKHAGGYELMWSVTCETQQEYTLKINSREAEDGILQVDLTKLVSSLGIWYDGDIVFRVRSLGDETGSYADSDYSAEYVYAYSNIPEGMTLLPCPEQRNIASDGTASWHVVEGAGSYRLIVRPENADSSEYEILLEDAVPEADIISLPLNERLDSLAFFYHGELSIDIQAVPEDDAHDLPGNPVLLGRYYYVHDPEGQTMLELPAVRRVLDNGTIEWSPCTNADTYMIMLRCVDGLSPRPEYIVDAAVDPYFEMNGTDLLQTDVLTLLRAAEDNWLPLTTYAGNIDLYIRADSHDDAYASSVWGSIGRYYFVGDLASQKVILDIPKCTLSEDGILTWRAVEHADGYGIAAVAGDQTIFCNYSSDSSGHMKCDIRTSLYRDEVAWSGKVDVYIQAGSGDMTSIYIGHEYTYVGSFDYSYVSEIQLDDPQGLVTGDGIAKWDPVWGTSWYALTISMENGEETSLTADNSMIENREICMNLLDALGDTGPCGVDATVYIQACYPNYLDKHISSEKVILGYLHAHHGSLEFVEAAEADCTAAGNTAYQICRDCGNYYDTDFSEIPEDSWVIPPLGHDWSETIYEWDEGNTAVTASRICSRDISHRETETAAAVLSVAVSPTETEKGQTMYTARFENPAFEIQIRTAADIPSLSEMDTLYLPPSLKRIEDEAFANTTCEAVIVPEGCTEIGRKAFAGCENLLYIRIPDSVTTVAEDAFEGCGAVRIDPD